MTTLVPSHAEPIGHTLQLVSITDEPAKETKLPVPHDEKGVHLAAFCVELKVPAPHGVHWRSELAVGILDS